MLNTYLLFFVLHLYCNCIDFLKCYWIDHSFSLTFRRPMNILVVLIWLLIDNIIAHILSINKNIYFSWLQRLRTLYKYRFNTHRFFEPDNKNQLWIILTRLTHWVILLQINCFIWTHNKLIKTLETFNINFVIKTFLWLT